MIEDFKTVYYGTVESINKLKNGSLDKISEKSFESLDSSSMSLFWIIIYKNLIF